MKQRIDALSVGRAEFLVGRPAGLPYRPRKVTRTLYVPRLVPPDERKPKP